LDSLVLLLAYGVGVWLIRANQPRIAGAAAEAAPVPPGTPTLRTGLIGFALAAAGLAAVTPLMVRSSAEIAEISGLGTTFVGTTLVALVTSLPEMVTTVAAIRLGDDDMAIGNLFGSNMFNMMAIGLTDAFYLQGRFLGAIDPAFLLVGMLGLLMTGLGLIGNLARLERRVFSIELDALALMVFYFAGLWLLFARGMGR
jgi:cation:H+ antiporter